MSNDDQKEFWRDAAGPAWVDMQSHMDALMQPVLDLVLERAALSTGARVLDIGCGTGTSVAMAADAVGGTGHVTGLDISDTMLAHARVQLTARTNTTLVLADAQRYGFAPDSFETLISRFGVMFFEDSVAAFANMAKGLVPEGTMTFAAWGPAPNNPFFMYPAQAAAEVLGPMPKVDRTLPGPFAFEDTTRVIAMLQDAGLVDVTAETVDLHLTPDGDMQAVSDLCCQIGPAQASLKFHDATAQNRNSVAQAIAARFAPFDGPDGVRIPAAINLYAARKSA